MSQCKGSAALLSEVQAGDQRVIRAQTRSTFVVRTRHCKICEVHSSYGELHGAHRLQRTVEARSAYTGNRGDDCVFVESNVLLITVTC